MGAIGYWKRYNVLSRADYVFKRLYNHIVGIDITVNTLTVTLLELWNTADLTGMAVPSAK